MTADARYRLAAPAKINLWLRVIDRRSDGYHRLESGLALLELADELEVTHGPGRLSLAGEAEDLPADSSNLAWQGFEAGIGRWPSGRRLTLTKAIPLAAGLGGGSSDAAAAWRLARRLLGGPNQARPTAEEAAGLQRIGADVPFFAAALTCARVSGIGETVVARPALPPDSILLVHPPFGLSTRAVFEATRPADWRTERTDPEEGWNDLWPAALRLRPELGDLRARVERAGGEPHLSGSGPTLWLRNTDPEAAAALVRSLAAEGLRLTETRFRTEPASIVVMQNGNERSEIG